MKLHYLKIKAEYANAKLRGDKPFEIRLNDRDFRVGDVVKYTCIDSSIVDEKNIEEVVSHYLYNKLRAERRVCRVWG